MKVMEPTAWVVYNMTVFGKGSTPGNSVCSQSEWEAIEAFQPGHHTLIRAHIGNEAEAERLARELQVAPTAKPKSRVLPQRLKVSVPSPADSQQESPISS